MPTVLRLDGLRVVIYPNDHRPAHVHVVGRDAECVFDLRCPDGPPLIRQNFQFSRARLTWIAREIGVVLGHLCEEWRLRHGSW